MMRINAITAAIVAGLLAGASVHADEEGRVLRRQPQQPVQQQQEQPGYGYGGYDQSQVYGGGAVQYQNPAIPLPPNQYYVPGNGLPADFRCVQCLINFVAPNMAEIIALDPNGMYYRLLPAPINVGPMNSYLNALIDSIIVQTGRCTNLAPRPQPYYAGPAPVQPPVYAPYGGPGYGAGNPPGPIGGPGYGGAVNPPGYVGGPGYGIGMRPPGGPGGYYGPRPMPYGGRPGGGQIARPGY